MDNVKLKQRWRTKYPGYSEAAYEAMERVHSGPLPKVKHAEVLKLYAQGKTRAEICTALHLSNNAIQISTKFDPEFRKAWQGTERRRKKGVRDKLIESLLVGTTEIRTRKVPKKNKDGSLVLDKNGQPVLEVAEVQVIERPPSPNLVQFFLSRTDPEFGAPTTEGEGEAIPIEQMKSEIRKAINAN